MFCPSCGTQLADNAIVCTNCGKKFETSSGSDLSNKAVGASKSAFEAFKILIVNPVGGVAKAYENLGSQQAFIVGIVFAIAFTIFFLIGVLRIGTMISFALYDINFGDAIKLLITGALFPVSVFGSTLLFLTLFKGEVNVNKAIFISGVAVLPIGILWLLGGILGLTNFDILGIFMVFAFTYTILLLFSGTTKLSNISEQKSAITVSLIILVSLWLFKVLFSAIMLP